MREFYEGHRQQRANGIWPVRLAEMYCRYLWNERSESLKDAKRLSTSRYYLGLSVQDYGLSELTKRSALISDTLLLTHDGSGVTRSVIDSNLAFQNPRRWLRQAGRHLARAERRERWNLPRRPFETTVEVICPEWDAFGNWIADAEPLLRAGLAWYLPRYQLLDQHVRPGEREVRHPEAIDYLIRDGRVVDASGATPVKSQLVRPILELELPFLTGVSMRDFSRITIEEFASYCAFRDYVRNVLLSLDDSLNAVQSERELARIEIAMRDQVRAVKSNIDRVRRTRAVSATGVAVGSVTTLLAAVYGPALEQAIQILGVASAGGGVWSYLNVATQNSKKTLTEDKWYYVWILSKKSERPM